MDHRQALRFVAAGRIAIGAAMLAAPRRAAAGWMGPGAATASVGLLARAFGAREVALGVGTLKSLDAPGPSRGWVMAGVLADGLDAVSAVLAIRQLGVGRAATTAVVAVAATAIGVASLDHVD
jgi:hypothetical protein